MTAQPATLKAFIDAARDSVAREIATVRREAQREREAFAAEMRAVRAEWDARLSSVAEIERRLAERLASVKDGEPGRDGAPGVDGVNGADGRDGASVSAEDVAALIGAKVEHVLSTWERPQDGRSVTVDEVAPMIADAVATAFAAIQQPKDGRDGADGKDGKDGADGQPGERGERGFGLADFDTELIDDGRTLLLKFSRGDVTESHEIPLPEGPAGRDGKDGEPGPEGPAGKLPPVAEWADRVHYEGEVVTRDGAVFQAKRDTGKEPGHEDWLCVVAAGRNGADGRSFTIRGTWSEGEAYTELDVVALNGASFAARRDNPGPCPGDGWQLIASQGKRGNPGERGPAGKGERGPPGPGAVSLAADGEGLMILTNGDGSTVECDLYPLLSKLS